MCTGTGLASEIEDKIPSSDQIHRISAQAQRALIDRWMEDMGYPAVGSAMVDGG